LITRSWIRRLLARTPRRRREAGTPGTAPRGIDVIPANGDGTFSSPIKSCSEIGSSILLAMCDFKATASSVFSEAE
jgi:hypothetical protein